MPSSGLRRKACRGRAGEDEGKIGWGATVGKRRVPGGWAPKRDTPCCSRAPHKPGSRPQPGSPSLPCTHPLTPLHPNFVPTQTSTPLPPHHPSFHLSFTSSQTPSHLVSSSHHLNLSHFIPFPTSTALLILPSLTNRPPARELVIFSLDLPPHFQEGTSTLPHLPLPAVACCGTRLLAGGAHPLLVGGG